MVREHRPVALVEEALKDVLPRVAVRLDGRREDGKAEVVPRGAEVQ